MHIFDNNTSINRDAVVNQLCAVVVPILFICVGLLFIWGERLANQLLRKDTYDQKRIQIRAYGIVRTSITALLMIFALVYFLCYGIWDMAIIFAFALLGYAWIKVSTYCVRLDYTYRHIRIRSHRTSLQIPFADYFTETFVGDDFILHMINSLDENKTMEYTTIPLIAPYSSDNGKIKFK